MKQQTTSEILIVYLPLPVGHRSSKDAFKLLMLDDVQAHLGRQAYMCQSRAYKLYS